MAVMHPTAKAEFLIVKPAVVMACGVLHRIVIGEKSLKHDLSRTVSSSGAPCHLREQLKRPLGRAKVRQA